jgi:ATP-dependent DNA helicase DinG
MISVSESGGSGLAERVKEIFSATGPLSASKDFEYRREQEDLAVAVAESFLTGCALVAEAGTGVGKSLAYLVPAAKFALETGRKGVISTHTINLQEQLVRKDIPIVRKILGEELPAVLLKGRQNYLCPARLRRAWEQAADLFTTTESDELGRIRTWADATKDGTLSDMPFQPTMKVWLQVCSEAHSCTQRYCGPKGNCFFQEARKAAADAKLVVVNHTLFFALLNTSEIEDGPEEEKMQGFLFPNDFAVLDEAHTIEQVAAVQLGLRISQAGLRFDLQRLYNPRTRKGLLKGYRKAAPMLAVERGLVAVEKFFGDVGDAAKFGEWSKEFRVRRPELVQNHLAAPLRELWDELSELADDTENESSKNELMDAARKLRETHAAVGEFLDQKDEECVYWVEKSGREETQFSCHGAPVNVADRLRPLLFSGKKSVVMTSATLGVGDPELGYFRKRVGAEGARALSIGSPFDYRKQMKIRIHKSIPDPNTPKYDELLAKGIMDAVAESDGRAFVLFTSYRTMRDAVREVFQGQGLAAADAGRGDAAAHDAGGVPRRPR